MPHISGNLDRQEVFLAFQCQAAATRQRKYQVKSPWLPVLEKGAV